MNETTFSRWLCKHLKDIGCFFLQRLEVTTGAGVPDIVALKPCNIQYWTIRSAKPFNIGYTSWIETKWKTKHIRPEQYIWGKKALDVGVNVNYIVGYEETLELLSIENAEKMSKSWKLTNTLFTGDRTKKGVEEMIQYLQ